MLYHGGGGGWETNPVGKKKKLIQERKGVKAVICSSNPEGEGDLPMKKARGWRENPPSFYL